MKEILEKKNMARKAHCLVLAYPLQGHINPMLQFSKLLEHQGVRITLATYRFYHNNLQRVPPSFAIETISDGFDQGGPIHAESHKAYMDRSSQVGSKSFAELLEKLGQSKNHVDCVVYDSFFPWALDVVKRFGIVGAVFLTQNMTVNSIYYHVHLGNLQVPLIEHEFSLPSLPKLQLEDMPSFLLTYVEHPYYLDFFVDQFSNVDKADWVLCNSFYELDKEVADWITKIWPNFRNIGPNIPSMFLDKRHEDDQDYGVAHAQFKREECIEWLYDKPKGSVVYVSFGSIAMLSGEQMEELAYGLNECSSYFLWVVRASEEIKLPKGFEKKSKKGLIVTWCSQLKVLAHEAIGCFVTHCGWNSTLETLCLGVPTILIPHWSDQTTNAKLMADVWKIGIRAQTDEKKIVRQETLKQCIRDVMKSEEGKVIKSNLIRWKTLALKSVGKGGSSYQNIIEFTNNLFCSQAS